MKIILVHHRHTNEYAKLFTDDIYHIRGMLNSMNWKYEDCKFFYTKDNISLRDFKPNNFERTKIEMLCNS
jgi:hypothetical protein